MSADAPKEPAGGFGAPRRGQREDVTHEPARPMPVGTRFFVLCGYVALAVVGTFIVTVIVVRFRYDRGTTTHEAMNTTGQIAKDVMVAYEKNGDLCPSSSAVPATVRHGQKYQSSKNDWAADPGWSCLEFEMTAPQYYQYRYERRGDAFTITAIGDLDDDGVLATFVARGRVDPGSHRLRIEPVIDQTNPNE